MRNLQTLSCFFFNLHQSIAGEAMNVNNIPQYEPSSDEIRYMIERVRFLDACENYTEEHAEELLYKYQNYRIAINCDRHAWEKKNKHLLPPEEDSDSEEFLRLCTILPEDCYYFKYGDIEYQSEASCSEDPASFSLDYGASQLIWKCYHALPDEVRRSERDILRYCYGWLPEKDTPTQEQLRAWIKGKTKDDPISGNLVRRYIIKAAPQCYVAGYSMYK